MIKASIIVPTFNRGYILGEAIQSILDQTYPHFELIIVDDGSTDDTADVVGKFKDDRVHLIRHPKNAGVATARNTGIAAAQGDLISFLDSDDLWNPNKLALESSYLDGHPELDAVFTDLSKVDGEHSVPSIVRTCPIFKQFLTRTSFSGGVVVPRRTMYLCMLQEMPIKIPATTFRREALCDTQQFQEAWRSGEDWEFLLRFTWAHLFGFIDRPLVIQRIMSDSTLGRHKKADALMLTEQFIREKRSLRGDREAVAAVRRGIATHSDRLGSFYRDENKLLDSAKAYLRGLHESGDLRLLAKTLALPLPRRLRNQVKRLMKAMSP